MLLLSRKINVSESVLSFSLPISFARQEIDIGQRRRHHRDRRSAKAGGGALRGAAAANEWYDHTLYSRLNDKRYGAIVIVMQRLGGQIVNRIKSSTVLQAIV